MANVLGWDLSLTGAGIACADGHSYVLRPKVTGVERLAWYREALLQEIGWYDRVDLVAIEGYSYASRNGGERIGELGGVARLLLRDYDVPFVEVSPTVVKKLATGSGAANKDQVLAAAIRRLDPTIDNNNAADAAWLRAVGKALLGEPVVDLPQTHLVALQKLSLPEGVAS